MLDRKAKAFDFAQDSVKQIITISTAIITFTVGFLKDLAANAPQFARDALSVAWILYFLSVCAGVGALLRLSGELDQNADPTIYDGAIRAMVVGQVLLFVAGLLLTLFFGINAQSGATP